MSNDTGYGPGRGSMFRRKRSATLEKFAIPNAFVGALAPERILHPLHYHEAVQCRLTRKESCFAPMFVMRFVAQQPHRTSTADESRKGFRIRDPKLCGAGPHSLLIVQEAP